MAIDRKQLVGRHNPVVAELLPRSPLSVGNGHFAFTADLTGMQSIPQSYECPLGTQSEWGWHSSEGRDKYRLSALPMEQLVGPRGTAPYPTKPFDRPEVYHWLRQNPHRLQLAQIGLCSASNGVPESRAVPQLDPSRLSKPRQELDLWTGVISSTFLLDGVSVAVETLCHPVHDTVAFRIRSPLFTDRMLRVAIAFPSPSVVSAKWEEAIDLNWSDPDSHRTIFFPDGSFAGRFLRRMDDDRYEVAFLCRPTGNVEVRVTQNGPHVFELATEKTDEIELVLRFGLPESLPPPTTYAEVRAACERHWAGFWSSGGALELAESTDPRGVELERRVVLSQYLTAINSAGTLPPQETGLVYNSWFGKFHLEMHWWHAAHFALWGRTPLMERSMRIYSSLLPLARELAASQGYEGARWPKQVGPDGRQSPSPISPLLIWQQPHPIVLAELCYRADPRREVLERYQGVVEATADFMASFAREARGHYALGPPLIPAQERHAPETTCNPPFELEYWYQGLETALAWRSRLGLEPVERWRRVAEGLSPLPVVDGVYAAHEGCADTFTAKNTDHPSMLGAFGLLPGALVDPPAMRRTLDRVVRDWQWDTCWGWDFPMAAMTAARLGEGSLAVDLLLMDSGKNTYRENGHNDQGGSLLLYLPGNGGLLAAVAMMAAGTRERPGDAPGFPSDGTWTVSWEGLNPWL